MLRKFSWGPKLVGVGLIGAGICLFFNKSIPLLNPVAIVCALILIQLFHGGRKPTLGLIGIASVVIGLLLIQYTPTMLSPNNLMKFLPLPELLITLALGLPVYLGIILVGVSMNQTKIYPSLMGTLLALTPLLGAIILFNNALAIVFVLVGVVCYRSSSLDQPPSAEEVSNGI
jgi:hypothetical protein